MPLTMLIMRKFTQKLRSLVTPLRLHVGITMYTAECGRPTFQQVEARHDSKKTFRSSRKGPAWWEKARGIRELTSLRSLKQCVDLYAERVNNSAIIQDKSLRYELGGLPMVFYDFSWRMEQKGVRLLLAETLELNERSP